MMAYPPGLSAFRFLDLPFELRREIIEYTVCNHHTPLKPQPPQDRFESDFTIYASGLKCHFLSPFSLILVNKQIRHEVQLCIFQNASVCLSVEIPRYGLVSDVANSLPRTVRILKANQLLCDLAREITVVVRAEPVFIHPRPSLKLHSGLSVLLVYMAYGSLTSLTMATGWVQRTGPFHRKRDDALQALVDVVVGGFRRRKDLRVVLYLRNLRMRDLRVVLGLLGSSGCSSITLEEVWAQWEVWADWQLEGMRKRVINRYKKEYQGIVPAAAEGAGQSWILSAQPSLEQFEVVETYKSSTQGDEVLGKRRRVFSR